MHEDEIHLHEKTAMSEDDFFEPMRADDSELMFTPARPRCDQYTDGEYGDLFRLTPQEEAMTTLKKFLQREIVRLNKRLTFGFTSRTSPSRKIVAHFRTNEVELILPLILVENFHARSGVIPSPSDTGPDELLDDCFEALKHPKSDAEFLEGVGLYFSLFVVPILGRKRGMARKLITFFDMWTEELSWIDSEKWRKNFRLPGMSLATYLRPTKATGEFIVGPLRKYIARLPEEYCDRCCERIFGVLSLMAQGVRGIQDEIDEAITSVYPHVIDMDLLAEVVENMERYRDSL